MNSVSISQGKDKSIEAPDKGSVDKKGKEL